MNTLQNSINRINNVLSQLGERRAYNIKHPSYNYRGYCFNRIVAGIEALGLSPPEDVPCYDFLRERYVPGEFFWKLWAWDMNQ